MKGIGFVRIAVVASVLFTGGCEQLDFSSPEVEVKLPEAMITVKGERVQSIRLPGGTAAILRYEESRSTSLNQFHVGGARPGKSVRLGGYFYGGWPAGEGISQTQTEWVANNLDVLTLNQHYPDIAKSNGLTPEESLELRQMNPKLKYYLMLFGTTLREPLFDPALMSEWTLKDKNGNELLGVRREWGLDEDHLMDMGNPDYAKFFRELIVSHTNTYHADGVAIDEIMWDGYWGVNVKEMRDYASIAQVRQSAYNWLEIIAENNPKEIIHQAFWDAAQRHTKGIWGEASFYSHYRSGAAYTIFYESMDYNEIINSLNSYGKRGETYIWAAHYERDSRQQLEYAIATYLLGINGTYVVFQPQPDYDGGYPNNLGGYDLNECITQYENNKDLFDVELGQPISDYYTEDHRRGRIWIREFEDGIVYVNPNP